MSEIAFDGIYNEGPRFDDEWGLDGWTSRDVFKLLITGEDNAAIAHLNVEQCSQLAAVLIEHVKEVHDAAKESSS
jgi:hypothetical protein